MALQIIHPFNYETFLGILDGVLDDLLLTLENHEPQGWETILNRYQFGEMGRPEGEAVRVQYHNELLQAQNDADRIQVMNNIIAWGKMARLGAPLANDVNVTLHALNDEQNLDIDAVEGRRIASISKVYEMWNPNKWIIYDSYSAKGLQWLVSSFWNNQQQEVLSEYLRFPFPPGRAHTTLNRFPILGTPRQAALGFIYASWLARAFAELLNNNNQGNNWQAFHVEMALFQLGHEI